MKKGVIIASVAAVTVVAAIVVLRNLKKDPAELAEQIPVVEAQTPEIGNIELYRNLVGKVEPSDVVYIYPKMAGEVTEIYVKAGDVVAQGQAICKIDTKQVESARLTLQSTEIGRSDAQTNLARQQALFAAGDISSAVYEQAQTAAKNAQIQYETAKLNYDNQIEYSNITATIAGKIEICDIEVHDNISSQNLICVISGEGSKAVSFSVPEKVVNQLHVGDLITLEKSGMEYEGSINEISSMIDASTGLFKIKASVEEGDALATGSTVKLYVTSDKVDNVMTLPVDAIYYSGGDAFLYTYDSGNVHVVPVEVGIYDSERIEILSGITIEDKVITTWTSELYEGSRVDLAGAAVASAESVAAIIEE
ncbi:MAG: efflux RND transporter periplasmic adaptor subunit [Lachnospiraceae bacterium]